jgi:alpha-beta hydrolase superfamily lysophospholipase
VSIRIRDLSNVTVDRIELKSCAGLVRGLLYSGGASPTCIVIAHGYSSSKHNVDPLAYYLATEGLKALTFDFQGHKLGCSSLPLARAEDVVQNVADALEYARNIQGVRRVIAAGHSMGAAASIGAMLQTPWVDGLIVMCTALGRVQSVEAASIVGGLRNRACYVDGPSPEDLTRVMDSWTVRIGEVSPRPLLTIAAAKDAIVAPSAVRKLFDAAGEPKTFEVIDATHTDCVERSKFVVMRWLRSRGFSPSRSNG